MLNMIQVRESDTGSGARLVAEASVASSLLPAPLARLASLAIALVAATSVALGAAPKGKPSVELSPVKAALGDVTAKELVTSEVLLKNTGDEPITFTRVTTSCGCVNGTVETREIKPGDSATLTLSLNVPGVNGPEKKTLYVFHSQGREPIKIPVSFNVVGGEQFPPKAYQGANKQTPAPDVKVAIMPEVADFGVIAPDDKAEMIVLIRNDGDKPVRFTRVGTSCTCATGTIESREIKPGDAAKLTVRFKASPNPAPVTRTLEVYTAGSAKPVQVPVKARVSYQVSASPFFINMLSKKNGEITLESMDATPFRVLSANGHKPVMVGADKNDKALKHVIRWDLEGVAEDAIPQFYLIETDHPLAPLLDLRVIHMGLMKQAQNDASSTTWILSQDRMLLGRLAPGQSIDREIKLVRFPGDAVDEITSPNGQIKATVISAKQTGRALECVIRITPTPDENGKPRLGVIRSELVFHAGGHQGSVKVFAKVIK